MRGGGGSTSIMMRSTKVAPSSSATKRGSSNSGSRAYAPPSAATLKCACAVDGFLEYVTARRNKAVSEMEYDAARLAWENQIAACWPVLAAENARFLASSSEHRLAFARHAFALGKLRDAETAFRVIQFRRFARAFPLTGPAPSAVERQDLAHDWVTDIMPLQRFLKDRDAAAHEAYALYFRESASSSHTRRS